MAAPSSLDMLIDLATDNRDDAAVALGQLRTAHHRSEAQLEALIAYRAEYQRSFDEAMTLGMSIASLHNYQRFIASLENAIDHQRQALSSSQNRVEGGKSNWQSQQRRLQSYDVLAVRRREAADKVEARREQNQSDEYASRAVSALGGF